MVILASLLSTQGQGKRTKMFRASLNYVTVLWHHLLTRGMIKTKQNKKTNLDFYPHLQRGKPSETTGCDNVAAKPR